MGTQEPRMGTQEPRMGTQEPSMGTQEPEALAIRKGLEDMAQDRRTEALSMDIETAATIGKEVGNCQILDLRMDWKGSLEYKVESRRVEELGREMGWS
jgi:hypothetical protein